MPTTESGRFVGSIPGPSSAQGLKINESEGTSFALQTARPSRVSDDHIKWKVSSPGGDVKIVGSICTL